MRTLFMDRQAWVSPPRSGPRRVLVSRVFVGAALVLLGFAGLEAASLVQQGLHSRASSTPSSVELVVTGAESSVPTPPAVPPTNAEPLVATPVLSPAVERAASAHPPPSHRFAAGGAASGAASQTVPVGTPDCKLPYALDPNGRKRWKLECL